MDCGGVPALYPSCASNGGLYCKPATTGPMPVSPLVLINTPPGSPVEGDAMIKRGGSDIQVFHDGKWTQGCVYHVPIRDSDGMLTLAGPITYKPC